MDDWSEVELSFLRKEQDEHFKELFSALKYLSSELYDIKKFLYEILTEIRDKNV